MRRFSVTFNARKVGALGTHSLYRFTVSAETEAKAVEAARVKAYADGLEHVYFSSIVEVS